MADSEDDEEIRLSSTALAALKDFYSEQEAHKKDFELLKSKAEAAALEHDDEPVTMAAFMEDWNASQFWYTQETADSLARELLKGASSADAIAFISAPSAFLAARNMLAKLVKEDRPGITLLEYDERFAVFPEFIKYDFNKPLDLPVSLKKRYTRIIADPPFLSDECQTKTALTVHWLAANPAGPPPSETMSTDSLWLAIATGERVGTVIQKLYGKKGVHRTDFEVKHQKGLSNEFNLYANFSTESWSLVPGAFGD